MAKKHAKRHFLVLMPPPQPTLNMDMPLGVSAPSQTRQLDSVLYLLCPTCLVTYYISRGLYRYLMSTQEIANALLPGVFEWINPRHAPCGTLWSIVSLSEEVDNEHLFVDRLK